MQVFAILPAAGLGTRMAGPQPKQFLALDGVPILIHSLRAFALRTGARGVRLSRNPFNINTPGDLIAAKEHAHGL